ncbi:hypothetical protein [Azospirillum argentinense]|uniref:Uncharacterized protein n=1 Tax=Azospirillum argentinense TaxID=2970906 RepID=A0A5B0KQ80_9PROT|nr:hypothetical protein [Azospirillum argentinense]KAA1054459.1 hypothetical protein FH063_006715 [Azospirillum argentinense]
MADVLSKDMAESIKGLIDSHLQNHPLAGSAAAPDMATMSSLSGDFCSVWPQAKPILELVSGLIIMIPGLGQTAGVVLKALVEVGDKVYGQTCKPA